MSHALWIIVGNVQVFKSVKFAMTLFLLIMLHVSVIVVITCSSIQLLLHVNLVNLITVLIVQVLFSVKLVKITGL